MNCIASIFHAGYQICDNCEKVNQFKEGHDPQVENHLLQSTQLSWPDALGFLPRTFCLRML